MRKILFLVLLFAACTPSKKQSVDSLLGPTAFLQDTLYDKDGNPLYVRYYEEIPVPPEETANIDNVDPRIIYSGTWYSGSTTASGFYPAEAPTMAYASVANNSATLTFNGTYVEVFMEYKVGHGSGIISVDGVAEPAINFGTGTTGGASSVFKKTLPAGDHTLKITVVGTGNIVFDYVKIKGSAVTPPPTGILLIPGIDPKNAIESASSGTNFQLGNGTYPVTSVNVPTGVSILPPVSGTAVFNYVGTAIPPGSSEQAVIQLKSGTRTSGNQTISGFTLKGNNLANGGIMVDNRDYVTVSNVMIENTNFFGGWVKNASYVIWYGCAFMNTSWASTGWCSGELNLFNVKTGHFHHNTFTNTLNTKGYGIKSMWGNNTWDGVIIEDCTFNLVGSSVWNNGSGPNIDIEFHDTWVGAGNVVIRNNKLKNMISATGNKTTGNTGRWIIENNDFSLQPGSTCHVEIACSNITIKGGTMRGAPMITANFKANAKYNDCVVDGVDFVSNNANPGWGGTFLIGPTGVTNFVYKNSKITKGNYTLVKFMGVTGGVSDGGGNTIN